MVCSGINDFEKYLQDDSFMAQRRTKGIKMYNVMTPNKRLLRPFIPLFHVSFIAS